MTIKTGRIRRLYDEALNNNIISPNMLMMAISALNNEINYNDKLISKTVADYIKYRNIITKEAINNGVSKNRLINVIRTLSPERYPSYNQILKLITLINSKTYNYQVDYIPDSDLKYRTDKELQELTDKKVIHRNQDSIEQEKLFKEICEVISDNFMSCEITVEMQSKLRRIKASNEVILQILKWYICDIKKAINSKQFESSYNKFCYIVSVINKKIPDTIASIEYRKKQNTAFWNDNAKVIIDGDETLESVIEIQCDKYPDSEYYGKHEYVRKQLLQAIELIKKADID